MSEPLARGTGKRKCASARVKMRPGKGKVIVNNKLLDEYLCNRIALIKKVTEPLELTENTQKYDFIVKAEGGGISGQADAIRAGVAKCLLLHDNSLRTTLKSEGMLTRDSRIKERKKYGRKRARKRFQFSKR